MSIAKRAGTRTTAVRLVLVAVAAGLFAGLAPDNADARKRRQDAEDGYVTAESRFGNGSVSGAVRMTDLGPQVRLPSGHWEYCRRSCSETLRVESIDFNADPDKARFVGPGGLANECGIFGCLDVGIGRRERY